MTWSSLSLSFADVLWISLAFIFLAAAFVHGVSSRLLSKPDKSRPHMLFQDLIRYGKTKQNLRPDDWLHFFDVPKRWFWHFYVISVIWNSLLLLFYLSFTFQHQSHPSWLTALLDIWSGVPSADSQVPQLSTLLVQLLLCVHSLRRLQECLCVSVFSDGSMHLVQYLFGLVYYVIVGLTALSTDRLGKGTGSLLSQMDWFHLAGSVLFIWASWMQHQSMVLLARLRTGKSGSVQTLAHRLPQGGWFELVSCPHYFAELVIYIGLGLVLGGLSLTWWIVVLYVLFSQGLEAHLCHDFYKSKYESYPKHRKAFIPFVL